MRLRGGCHCGAVRFDREQGEETLTTCTCNTGVAKHRFCNRCGIDPFDVPRSHPDGISVNARCLDGVEESALHIEDFEGQNREANVEQIGGCAG